MVTRVQILSGTPDFAEFAHGTDGHKTDTKIENLANLAHLAIRVFSNLQKTQAVKWFNSVLGHPGGQTMFVLS